MVAKRNDRTRDRLSQVRKGSPLNVTATLFQRPEDSGESGEFVREMKSYESRALPDPFLNYYSQSGETSGGFTFLQPDYNPQSLLKLPNESSVLRQCIDAMVTNIDSFGYRLEYIGEKDQQDSKASLAEKERISNLLDQPNDEYTTTELRERLRRDLETFGYGFFEIGRDKDGEVCMIAHVPAHTVRLTAKLSEVVPMEQTIKRDGRYQRIKIGKQFRRFVQRAGARMVYFKEFGDPRPINPSTGNVDEGLAFQDQATEMFHFTLYSPGSMYGLPRWIGNIPSITGIRESELTNLQFFKDNAIPAMAILVSGGALTGDTLSNIENHFTMARGRGAMNRVVVLEATGDEDAAGSIDGKIPPPKLEIKPLASERQTDELFSGYEENGERKIRASFRLPPLLVGRADDYSHASADSSIVVADAQVFGPERNKEDDIWNSKFLPINGMPLEYWRIRTNPPRLVSADSVLMALQTLDDLGAMTPNIAIGIANELFDLSLKPVEHVWGDFPFPLVMQLAIANNLDGLQEIMLVQDMLEQNLSNQAKLIEAKTLTGENTQPPKTGARPRPARDDGKAGAKPPAAAAKKPEVTGPEGKPSEQTAKKEVAERLAVPFRALRGRGNDIMDPFFYKKRARPRPAREKQDAAS